MPESEAFDAGNPILVDGRAGSRDLLPLLQARRLPAALANPQLEFGDLAWKGHGPHGECSVGVEYKTPGDCMSCMTSGRYAGHQLPGMLQAYDWVYLLIHGITREEPDTRMLQHLHRGKWWDVTVGQTRFMYAQYAGWLNTMQTRVGVKVIRVAQESDAAAEIHNLYRWWTQKQWGEHGSYKILYTPPPPQTLFIKPSLCRLWANALPGIGWEKSAAVEQRFKTGIALALADIWEWKDVPGIGPTIAGRAVKQIRGEED